MEIKPAPLPAVLAMRQEVMYPQQSLDFVKVEGDEQGLHLGVYEAGELISVVSYFEKEGQAQFRKFATRVDQQGKGYGSALLQYVLDYAKRQGNKVIWCNARTTATGIYEKFGMQATGESWQKWGIDFIKMEKPL